MDLEQQRGLGSDRFGIIMQMGAVGGADLAQARAAFAHHVGDPEGAADLDQLAARNDHLAPLGQRVERQQHGGRVVVDDRRRLGAGQRAQVVLDHPIAVAARAPFEVVFEVDRRARGEADRFHRGFRQHRAPEIGMDHHAGGVDHRMPCRTVGGAGLRAAYDFPQHRVAAGGQRVRPAAIESRRSACTARITEVR